MSVWLVGLRGVEFVTRLKRMSFYSEAAISKIRRRISAASFWNKLMKWETGNSWKAKCQAERTSSGELKRLVRTRLFSSVSQARLVSVYPGASFSCRTARRNSHLSLVLTFTRPGTSQDPVIAERATPMMPVRTGGVVIDARAVEGSG